MGGADGTTKTFLLPTHVATRIVLRPIVIEPRLADGNHPFVRRQRGELVDARLLPFTFIRVHPNEREGQEPSVDELATLAAHERVVAIGETGLDYYRSKDDPGGDMGWQQERFRRPIRAAHATRKPLIIHTREAADDTLRIMREE